MSEHCPFCGSGFGGPLCDESTNNETMGAYLCGSFFRPNMMQGELIFDGIGKVNIARSRVCELTQENAKLRSSLDAAHAAIGDLEDCRESLRKLGEYCGCDHVDSPDERQMQVRHIREAFQAKEQENAKLREAATLFRLYGLPPHDVSGVAAWDKAIKLLEGGAK